MRTVLIECATKANVQFRRQFFAELMLDSAVAPMDLKFPQKLGVVCTEQDNAHASARAHSERPESKTTRAIEPIPAAVTSLFAL